MDASIQIIKKLIERYDYCGAYEILKELHHEDSDAGVLLNSCRYAVNFDFIMAKKVLTLLSEETKHNDMGKFIRHNVDELADGFPDALFSELLENLKFQIKNEELIDFLGRVYRFKEAIYKYMFIKKHLNNRKFSLHVRFMQKKEILKILRNHYKIFNNNLIFAINAYFKKHSNEEPEVMEIIKILNSEKMNQLIELRHESLIGHGFRGVSFEEIQRVYGNPYMILDDFRACLDALDVNVYRFKYAMINDYILDVLNTSPGLKK